MKHNAFTLAKACVCAIALMCFAACSDSKGNDVLPAADDDITGFAVSTEGNLFNGYAYMVCADGFNKEVKFTGVNTWVFVRSLTYHYRNGAYKTVEEGSGLVFSGKNMGDITAEAVEYSPDSTLMYGAATYYLPDSIASTMPKAPTAEVRFHAQLKADKQPELIVYEFIHPLHGATTINFHVVKPQTTNTKN